MLTNRFFIGHLTYLHILLVDRNSAIALFVIDWPKTAAAVSTKPLNSMDIHHCRKYQSPGGVANGGMVQENRTSCRMRKLSDMVDRTFFIIKEEAEVTRGQFDQMMDDWLERRGGKVSAGWSPCVTADWLLGKK